ncbi:hypothetical protein WP12_04665 [Sphingomonas sp. SRS2]|nr:hypothetical protein WP12_04665 [Sphingomonas sp. SRS2]
MLSFGLEGGVEAERRFIGSIGTFTLAESLGGIGSLIAHPATMTHADWALKRGKWPASAMLCYGFQLALNIWTI